MAKVRMQKIEMIALLEDSKNIVERLQRRNAVEIKTCSDSRLVRLNTSNSVAGFEKSLATANSALEFLNKTGKKREPLLSQLNGRKPLTTAEFAKEKDNTDKYMQLCYKIVRKQKEIADLTAEIAKAKTKIDILKPWLNLDIAQNFSGTKYTKCFIGTVPGMVLKEEFAAALDNVPVNLEIVSSTKEQTLLAVLCLKTDSDVVLSKLREMEFSFASEKSDMTASEETDRLIKRIDDNNRAIEENLNEVKALDNEQEHIQFLIDFLTMRRDKYIAISEMGVSQHTVIIDGYIPQKYVSGLVSEFEKKYTIAIDVADPDDDEDVPVLLQNGKFSRPVEGITEMYALPNKRDVDPNPVMAFFYYLFFGMMLSDAGYGLVMTIATILVLKYTNVEGTLKRTITMFRNCGISTLFWGALFGSWFGDLPQVIAKQFFSTDIKTTALWFEPLNDPIKLLLFSFLLGIIHLFIGLAVNFKILWSEGKKADAIFDVIPVYLTIIGVAPIGASVLAEIPASITNISKYIALAGVVAIVLTSGRSSKNVFVRFFGGIYGLYNIATGYLSDILSYSRLLALGLATGSIASVINLIGSMPQNIVLKAVMLTVVGLIGHVANMGINLLGAYVHADRLQFVELFSKFYEGGGRAFKPFKANTKYFKFKKENIYE